jgi:nicotinamide mononucleotide adenylyltransferase
MYFDRDEVPNGLSDDMLATFVGGAYDFYGVDNNTFCIGSGQSRMALEAVQDPDDGYRSYFGCFATSAVDKIFFRSPIARVVFRALEEKTWEEGMFRGWVLEDVETGHRWLKVGTSNTDDYYPCFTFEYTPDRTKTVDV